MGEFCVTASVLCSGSSDDDDLGLFQPGSDHGIQTIME